MAPPRFCTSKQTTQFQIIAVLCCASSPLEHAIKGSLLSVTESQFIGIKVQ